MPEIKASPRNRLLGAFADVARNVNDFAAKPFGYDNPPVAMMAGLLGLPAVANTLNELSYGGALGTGSGMTWKPKADTVDAAMTLLPLGATAGKAAVDGGVALAKKAAPAIERAVPRIMEKGGLGAGILQDLTQGSRSQIFAGQGAKNADKAALKVAQDRIAAGDAPADVWRETGWGKGPDGKWRFEISDHGARFNTSMGPNGVIENDLTHGMNGLDLGPTVGGILDHSSLKSAYPDGLTTSTIIGNKNTLFGDGVQGSYSDKVLRLNAPAPASAAKSTTLHELQHAVQDAEGFSQGGSPGLGDWTSPEMRPQLLKIAREEMAAAKPPTYQQFWGNEVTAEGQAAYKKFLKEWGSKEYQDKLWLASQQGAPAKAYPRLAGEAEARLTQARMNLTPEQRAAQYPWEPDYFRAQTGVGLDELIHRGGNGPSMSNEGLLTILERNGQPMGLLGR